MGENVMADIELPEGFVLEGEDPQALPPGFMVEEESTLQTITPEQSARTKELQLARENRDNITRQRGLETRGIADPKESPSREELLLQQGLETEGPALRMARTKAGFTSNPIPVITQGLLEEFPDATPEALNVRFEPLVKNEEITGQVDNAILNSEAASEREIRDREADGEEITQEIRSKVFARNLQTALTKMPGLELVYNNPKTGRTTAVNPVGADLGDFAELLGPGLPLTGEIGGGGTGAVVGSPAGPLGTVTGATIGGGAGGATGEALRLGIGRMIGAEPEEADFIDPILDVAGESAFNSALGGGLNAIIANRIAKNVAQGKFGMESAQFARFLDEATFNSNKKAVERLNEMARSRGIKGAASPTFGQLTGNKEVLDMERSLASLDSPLTKMKAENAQFLDDVAGAFNPKTGSLKRDQVGNLISRIAGEIDKRIIAKEKTLGRAIKESEAREVASQVENIMRSDLSLDNAIAAEGLRDAAIDAERIIFQERFGRQFEEVAERAADVTGQPTNIRGTANQIRSEQEEEIFRLTSADEQRFLDEAALAGEREGAEPEVSFQGLSRGLSNLKETKRKIDAGQLPDKNARTAARMIAAGEQDLEDMLIKAGREDVLHDLMATRKSFGKAKRLSKKAFGKLLSRDKSGNFKVDDSEVFEKIVMSPVAAVGIKSMLIDTGQEPQLALIRSGIRDLYAKKFLPEGAAPGQLKGAAGQWFNNNKRALREYFSPTELQAFKNPVVMAKKEAVNRDRLAKAQKKMREWFGADLASTKDSPQEFMDVVFNKGTPKKMAQIKRLLPDDQWTMFKDLYKNDLLSKVRSQASKPGFDVNKIYSQTGGSASSSARERVGRETAIKILGKQELKDLESYADALNIIKQNGEKIIGDSRLDKRLKNIVRSLVKPLSMMSRRVNALISEGKNTVEARMERALANPEQLKKMLKAVEDFKKNEVPPASAIAFIEVLGSDLTDQLNEIEKEIKEE